MNTLTFEEKYAAILARDTSFEGTFVTAVVTTGIFCRPSCTARKPKPENVIFYDTISDAITNGYRPCKICKPLEHDGKMPEYIKHLLNQLNQNIFVKIKDYDLRRKNIDPDKLRRWFLKHYNMTFHAYQRMLRINTAFSKITAGWLVTDAAYDTGYDSLSGFNTRFNTIFGGSPTDQKDKTVINIVRFTTPLGAMYACATTAGVCLLEFTDRRMLETEFKDLCNRLNAVILPGNNPHLDQVQVEIQEYFAATRKRFSVKLDTPGTKFQQLVWDGLLKIPYGKTWSYKEQAAYLHLDKAVRAVASSNGQNRVSIIIPCHRVIGNDGSLTGYGGGLHRKKWLIDFEKAHSG